MPRFLVQSTAPQPHTPANVIWLHSYVTTDGQASFCLYDAPNANAIPRGPGDSVSEVDTVDPFSRTG